MPARGFSLIEVLVSMFIVSLGILALAGLLQSAARYGKMSELRSTATLMANDIADHIRANAAGAKAAAYDAKAVFPSAAIVAPPNPDCAAAAASCSAAQLAAHDMNRWQSRLRATLPDGSPYIEYHGAVAGSGQPDTVDVWVAWTDPNTTVSGTTERPPSECPAGLCVGNAPSVRCLYLQVVL
jgi:type IV pilus assembly protein PilV